MAALIPAPLVENIPPSALYVPRHETTPYPGPSPHRGMPPGSAGSPSPINVPTAPTNLIPHLLQSLNLPTDLPHLTLAHALLEQGLPVTAQTLAELTQTLAEIPGWGPPEALAAAQLKAAGLPLTPATLALFLQTPPPLAESFTRLTHGLRALSQPLPESLSGLLTFLENLPLPADAPPADLAAHAQRTLTLLYRSLEHTLATSAQTGDAETLLTFARLRDALAEHAPHLLKGFDQFFDGLRRAQFTNADPQTPPPNGRWLTLALPLLLPNPPNTPTPTTAHLRIACPPDTSAPLDLAQTRLILQIALTENQTMTIDLSIVNRQIGLQIAVPDPALQTAAETELPTLETALTQTGFTLRTARCTVVQGAPLSPSALQSGLNVEI